MAPDPPHDEAPLGPRELRFVVEHEPDPVAYVDAGERVRLVNGAFEAAFGTAAGRSIEAALGRNARQLGPHVRGALAGRRVDAAVTVVLPERGTCWMTVSAVPDEVEGAIVGCLVRIRDRTEERRIEDLLREHEARLRSLLDIAAEGIVTIDERGVIETFNPAAERIFGYARDEVIGRNVSMLMPSPDRERHDGYLRNYLRTGEAKIIGSGREVVGRRKDGSTFPMDLAVGEFHDQVGMMFMGIVRDNTERRRAEEQLRQADRLASIGSLAAGLGHDMSNVLLPIRTHLHALEVRNAQTGLDEHLRAIRESVRYLQQLSDSLHLLALDPADDEASGAATVLPDWWAQVAPLLGRSLPRHVRFSSSMPGGLPPVAVAPHRLTQAMLNLLVNAGDAVGSDGKVRVWAEPGAGRAVRISVSDNGAGMPEEIQRRVFDPFFTTKRRGLGTGLGLALVHGIVTGAGGAVEIDSRDGEGTTIALVLPAADPATSGDAAPGAGRTAIVTLADRRIAGLIATVLESQGFTVRDADSARDATCALWVTDPASTDLEAVREFVAGTGRQVIACGPAPPSWAGAGATVVERPADFELLRARIAEAVRVLDAQTG